MIIRNPFSFISRALSHSAIKPFSHYPGSLCDTNVIFSTLNHLIISKTTRNKKICSPLSHSAIALSPFSGYTILCVFAPLRLNYLHPIATPATLAITYVWNID